MGMKLTVNPIRCDGRGLCAVLLPELITLDDWGYPILAEGDVPPHLETEARRTASACPLLALSVICGGKSQTQPGVSQVLCRVRSAPMDPHPRRQSRALRSSGWKAAER